jgi:hypothetical protein
MPFFLALIIGAAAGLGIATSQFKLSNPQHLVIAGAGGAVAGVLANALLGGLLAAIMATIGQIALIAVAGGGVVYGAKQLGLFNSAKV